MYTLVTGGAGYIGTHTLLELCEKGHSLVVLDNLSNSSVESIKRVEKIAEQSIRFIEGNVCDRALLDKIFSDYDVSSVIHFAGLKAVGESVEQPLRYYDNNVLGSLNLLKAMANAGVFRFVFSSSATVYGDPEVVPISEQCPVGRPTNPYGSSKLMVEDILRDLSLSDPRWRIAVLRYFNPVGAHSSGLIGEDPDGIPNNLMPYISQVAVGKLPRLSVFGNDYNTVDGTGVRDYIHVVDLAKGHLSALDFLADNAGVHTWNLGTGKGYSVLEMVEAFERVNDVKIPYQVVDRRPGDIASCYADPSTAEEELGWKAEFGLEEMMQDAWRWQKNNPKGYR